MRSLLKSSQLFLSFSFVPWFFCWGGENESFCLFFYLTCSNPSTVFVYLSTCFDFFVGLTMARSIGCQEALLIHLGHPSLLSLFSLDFSSYVYGEPWYLLTLKALHKYISCVYSLHWYHIVLKYIVCEEQNVGAVYTL